MQKHPRQMRWRQFVPPLFIGGLLLSLFLTPFSAVFEFLCAGIVTAYLAADIGVSVMIASRDHWEYLPLLPVAFAAIHAAYGSGFLVGLIRFRGRWGSRNSWQEPQPQRQKR